MKSTEKIPADLRSPEKQRLTGRTYISEALAVASHTDVFKYAAEGVHREVHQKLAGRPYDYAFYYIAYEVVIDQYIDDGGDGGTSGSLRASPHRPTTSVVQPRLREAAAA